MELRAIIALSSVALLTLLFALVSGAGPTTCLEDADADGICDDPGPLSDNCTGIANPGQRDDDEDGYGNLCDEDVNNDCGIGGPDLAAVFANTLAAAPWVPKALGAFDVNEDGGVGGADLAQTFARALQDPGPSSRTCADCTAAIGTGVCP
ncbi:MAG: hypothetical protein IH881_18740 [Myxococcales bacterium]|nr:hypothetical protein [Myxococcales bacterium]